VEQIEKQTTPEDHDAHSEDISAGEDLDDSAKVDAYFKSKNKDGGKETSILRVQIKFIGENVPLKINMKP